MKKILSFFVAGALALGLIGCSGDLHDVSNNPYSATEKVYVLGGISSSKINTTTYKESAFADTKAYEVKVKDGKISFEFTYSGSDGWSAGDGKTAFAIVADVSGDWGKANACRWGGNGDIAVGTTGNLSKSDKNIVLSGLSAGTVYKFTADLTDAGGEMAVEAGLAAVPFELIWVDNTSGNLTNAVSITAESDKKFSYVVTPATEAKTYKFIARYGNNYYFPATEVSFDTEGNSAEAAKNSSSDGFAPLSVEIPSKADSDDEHLSGYKVIIELSDSKATFRIEKVKAALPYTLTTVFGTFGGLPITWDDGEDFGSGNNGKPYSNKKVYTGTAVLSKDSDNWGTGQAGRDFGVLTKDNDWSTKYTGAFLEEAGKEYELTNGATFNNLLKLKKLTSDITFTLKYTVYENVFNNGSYSDEAGSFTISYKGTGEKADEPTYPPKKISGTLGDFDLTWDGNTASTIIEFSADYKDSWNWVDGKPSPDQPKTYTFGLKLYSDSWFNAYKEGAIKLDAEEATALTEGAAGGNNVVSSETPLAGKKVKLTFTYVPDTKAVNCKATTVQ